MRLQVPGKLRQVEKAVMQPEFEERIALDIGFQGVRNTDNVLYL